MARTRRHSLLIVGIALIGLLIVPVGASAASCDWRNMMDAAANGRQIGTHTQACYRKALAELPSDVNNYEPAVRANLQSAMRRDADFSSPTASGNFRTEQSAAAETPAVAAAVRGPVTSLLEGLGPAHVDQVPIPVLALGGAAALLLLAGLGTSLSRVRSRRLTR